VVTGVLIRAAWCNSRERRERLLARTLALIAYHQANIAAAKSSHARRRKKRLRQRGIALHQCTCCCEKLAL
jgi:hypothetical protein